MREKERRRKGGRESGGERGRVGGGGEWGRGREGREGRVVWTLGRAGCTVCAPSSTEGP